MQVERPEIPKHWIWTTIDEIAWVTKLAGFEFTKHIKYQESGPVRVIRGLNLGRGKFKPGNFKYIDLDTSNSLPRSQLYGGELLIAYVGTLGTAAILPKDGNRYHLGPNVGKVVVSKEIENAKFFLFFFCSYLGQKMIHGTAKAVAQSSLSMRQIRSFSVPLPPLAEQQRIVDKIEELFSDLDSGINSLKTAQQQLKVYRQAVLKWAFEGKLTAQWREEQQRQGKLASADILLAQIKAERAQRYQKELEAWQSEVEAWEAIGKEGKKLRKPSQVKVPEPLNQAELDSLWPIPTSWQWGKLGEFFRVYVGATPSRKRVDYWDGDIPWVSSGEVGFCRIKKTEETITLKGLLNSSTEKHPPGTIMLGMIGEGKTRGQSAILDIGAAHNQNTAAIRVSETECVPELLFYYFYFQYQRTREIGSGNNQKALNKSRVESISYPLIPLEEQQEILAELESRLSICDQLEADIEANLKKAEALRQSILKQAFEGKLVPQDPNDEPAEVLLERIRGDREAQKVSGKPRTKPVR